MNASVSVLCYKYKTLSNGEHPLMLRIYKDNKRKLVSLGISVQYNNWDFTKNEPKPKCPNKDLINKIILDKKVEYQKQILELNAEEKDYTATTLVETTNVKYVRKTVWEYYNDLIKEFRESGKEGNRLVYKYSRNSLNTFMKGKLNTILFSDIDVNWLNRYEKELRAKKYEETSMSVLFRTLRSAYNMAIKAHIVAKKYYPFNEYKVSKFNVKTKKRALTKEDIMKVVTTETINPTQRRSLTRNIFTFSYLCGGIPIVDVANLTLENIQGGRLCYDRQKTGAHIDLKLCDEAKEIIEKYVAYREEAGYLFPIYDERVHKTAVQKHNRLHKVGGQINKELKVLASELEIDANLTTYVARHTFATVLRRSNVDIGIISEALGHTELSTTQIYLDSFENEQVDAAMSNLL